MAFLFGYYPKNKLRKSKGVKENITVIFLRSCTQAQYLLKLPSGRIFRALKNPALRTGYIYNRLHLLTFVKSRPFNIIQHHLSLTLRNSLPRQLAFFIITGFPFVNQFLFCLCSFNPPNHGCKYHQCTEEKVSVKIFHDKCV